MRTLPERVPTAAQYYRVTGDSFRALCPEASGHMNMGLWPAPTLRAAQERLVGLALAKAAAWARGEPEAPKGILDLGSGWGGSRALFHETFPRTPYFGVNLAQDQVEVARAATAHLPHTEYVVARVEDATKVPWDKVDLLFSTEAAFHFEEKASILNEAGARGVRLVSLLEICVEDPLVLEDPLLIPSLRHAWSTARYRTALDAAGLGRVEMSDHAADIFPGFLAYTEGLDPSAYRGRRAILDQLVRATRALVHAAERGQVRYVLLTAAAS
jgi:hypothetical protein